MMHPAHGWTSGNTLRKLDTPEETYNSSDLSRSLCPATVGVKDLSRNSDFVIRSGFLSFFLDIRRGGIQVDRHF